jgi:drug/metabolite transporter (DMT)-like permease
MVVAAFAAIYLIWGSTYLAIRVAVGEIPPLLLMGVRCTAAGALLVAWAALRNERPERQQWRRAVVAGALMIACTYGALGWAEQRLPSGIAALLSALSPLWLTTFEWPRRGRPRATTMLGLLLGVGGVGTLVGGATFARGDVVAAFVLIAGTVAWAAGSIYLQNGASSNQARSLSLGAGMPLLAGGLMLLGLSATTREIAGYDPHAVSPIALVALVYLIVFGSLVGFSAYAWLLRVAPASRVGTHAYVNPLVAVVLGWTVGGEPMTAATGVAAAMIAASVAMIVRAR